MNSESESFEAELGTMRPAAPSADLESRIAERLRIASNEQRLRPTYWMLAAGLVAASIAAFVFWPRGEQNSHRSHVVNSNLSDKFKDLSPTMPSVWTYHQALVQTPEKLDDLLARHAGQRTNSQEPPFPAHRGIPVAAEFRLSFKGVP